MDDGNMNVSIMGLGYVGAVSAACLAQEGNRVIGVDPNKTKVDLINAGKSPIIEDQVGDIIESVVSGGFLSATVEIEEAVLASELSLICVGTPSEFNGSLDLKFVRKVCEEIGVALKGKQAFHTIVVRSTMLPGSVETVVIPTLEEYSGKVAGKDFGVCLNPEFLREGTAVHDFYHPPKTVIGETDKKSGDLVESLFTSIEAPLIRTDISTAEMVKYVDNVWHALKVSFANEVGSLAKKLGLDSHAVMDIFCQDRKLNISPTYLKPGFAFGGSCLPKDVRAMCYKAKDLDLDLPVLSAINPSNVLHIQRGLDMIISKGSRKVGFLGFSFKAGTDDLRESPLVSLIESLIGKGYDLKIYDHNVRMASIVGANKDYILNRIPHVSRLMADSIENVLEHADTIVIGNGSPEFNDIDKLLKDHQVLVDLYRLPGLEKQNISYDGICW